ncbi:MAG: T9SS C-terminal target domain-containing protein [Calditrichaeota bacterium]|nr:MAG: T9SS C-terminal target domain-containing protein [Calditrichota bacterium]
MRQGVTIKAGDVVVNDGAAGATLFPGAEILVGKRVTVPAGFSVIGDRVTIKSQAFVNSAVLYNSLDAAPSALITGALSTPVTMPVFPATALPPFESAPAGLTDITVPDFGSLTLPPGDYGDITVGFGASLILEGGVYNVRNITVGLGRASLRFDKHTRVRIEEKFLAMKNAFVGPTADAEEDACGGLFYVAGINGVGGGVAEEPLACRFDNRAIVEANFYVPNGTLKIGKRAEADGAFIARDIDVAKFAEVDLDSRFEFDGTLPLPKLAGGSVGNGPHDPGNSPVTFALDQNFPNPFNPTTTIRFALPEPGLVTVEIYNIMGQKVKTLISDNMEAGYHQVVWDATNDYGSPVASGIYIYRMTSGAFTEVKKMTLLK